MQRSCYRRIQSGFSIWLFGYQTFRLSDSAAQLIFFNGELHPGYLSVYEAAQESTERVTVSTSARQLKTTSIGGGGGVEIASINRRRRSRRVIMHRRAELTPIELLIESKAG